MVRSGEGGCREVTVVTAVTLFPQEGEERAPGSDRSRVRDNVDILLSTPSWAFPRSPLNSESRDPGVVATERLKRSEGGLRRNERLKVVQDLCALLLLLRRRDQIALKKGLQFLKP
jgi:hypothetical protein